MIKRQLYLIACILAAAALVGLPLVLMFAQPARAMEQTADGFRLTPAEAVRCQAGGGCLVIPHAELMSELAKWLQKAFDAGRAEGCRGL